MTINSLAPGYVELFYGGVISGRTRLHKATYPIQPTGTMTVGNVPNFFTNDGNDDTATNLTNAWVDLVKVLFGSEFTFLRSDVYRKDTPTSDPLFIVSIPHGDAGTGSACVALSQITVSLKTNLGGNAKLAFMESDILSTYIDTFPFSDAPLDAVVDYALGNSGWIIGRDGGTFSTATRAVGKINDALRRKYFLND